MTEPLPHYLRDDSNPNQELFEPASGLDPDSTRFFVRGLPNGPKHDPATLNMKAMLTGDVNRLRYITRHSTSLTLHKENVAEHSYFVILYAQFICHWVECNFDQLPIVVPVDVLDVLQRCLFHDLDESRTGDFQRPFKHRSEKLKQAIEEAAGEEFQQVMHPVFPGDEDWVYKTYETWRDAKDDTVEGRIVAFADYLSVLSYLLGETGNANYSVMHHYLTLQEYTATFMSPEFDFIRPLVNDAVQMVAEMMKLTRMNGRF